MAKEQTKSFVLRIDAATMDALEGWADDEFRSINGQLQWIIADALRRAGRKPRGGAGAGPKPGAADLGAVAGPCAAPVVAKPVSSSPVVAAAAPAAPARLKSGAACSAAEVPDPVHEKPAVSEPKTKRP